ncbi:MAG: endopeptidase La [Proteobacteria bacterium]|nr:MAG: endopeptidase La [Pseudomonadota bacterium]
MPMEKEPEIIRNSDEFHRHTVPARVDPRLPDRIFILPVHARPFFPAQTMPIILDEERWAETIEQVGNTTHRLVGLVLADSDQEQMPSSGDFAAMGTIVRVHNAIRGEGKIQFIAEGLQRFRIVQMASEKAPFRAQVDYPPIPIESSQEIQAYALAIINNIKELLPLNPLYKENVRAYLERFNPDDVSPLADFAAALTSAPAAALQEVLDTVPLLRRMEKVMLLIHHELEIAGLQSEIRRKVQERVSEHQREFFLKEQLKEIQHELGISKDDKTVELERFRERLVDRDVPAAATNRIEEEMQKFSFLESGSPEYAVTRNYLDVLTGLPWGTYSEDQFDLVQARKILDRDHQGLDDVKDRIIEFLGVGALKGEISGSILCLVGPPGVGKTSIGRSVADALGRKFYRFSLGGMRDEAEIKGHRRTYIGAMPGKFIQALRDTKVSNPVIMLDEIDKVGNSYHGDPASALLEVLDPEQNSSFLDHYLDVRFDLSKVLFICTANQLDSIPRALLDRMEVIRLSGYLTQEKLRIAKRHLWPKQRHMAGLNARQVSISDAAMRAIIDNYAREAGVRNLEKQLGRIARKVVVEVLQNEAVRIKVGCDNLAQFLGQAVYRKRTPERGIGIVSGLAWTALGGVTLDVEAARVHTKNRGFKMTGQLGDIMRESAEIAYSYVGSHLVEFGADPAYFDNAYVHIHVPEGATPKDGPSAGITMATALLSLARGEQMCRPIAMTGELTLTGRVLPIGGVREKLVAAKRNGIKEVILPAANAGDFEELPDFIGKGIKVHFAENYGDVAAIVFK